MSEATFVTSSGTLDDAKAALGEGAEVVPELSDATDQQAAPKPEQTEASDSTEQPKTSGGNRVQRRIDTLTRRNKELEQLVVSQSERLREAIEHIESRQPEVRTQPTAAALSTRPTLDQFATHDDYAEALANWVEDRAVRAAIDKAAEAKAKAEAEAENNSRSTAYFEKANAARQKYEDFDDVVGRDDVMLPQHVIDAIIDSPNGPDIAYYLGSHEDVAQRLAFSRPTAAVMEIGRISHELETPRKVASKAPAPVSGVRAGSSSGNPAALDEMSYRDYKRAREAGH